MRPDQLPPHMQLMTRIVDRFQRWVTEDKRKNVVLMLGRMIEVHDYQGGVVHIEQEAWAYKRRDGGDYCNCKPEQALQHFWESMNIKVQPEPSPIIRPNGAAVDGRIIQEARKR